MTYILKFLFMFLSLFIFTGCGSESASTAQNTPPLEENLTTEENCVQVITHAYNPHTLEERDFSTPCDVLDGWIVGKPPKTENEDNKTEQICAQVITHAYNPDTLEERAFPTPCSVPDGWIVGNLPEKEHNLTISEKAIQTIANYDKDANLTPTVEDYSNAGVVGVIPSNLAQMNVAIAILDYDDVDTLIEIQAVFDSFITEAFTYITTYDMAKPDYNTSYTESNFASIVTRITDRSVQSANFHPYPKQGNAWNSDMTIINMGYRLYDANTFQELAVTSGLTGGQAYAKVGSPYHGAADIRWSKSNPNLMYVLDSHKRYKKVMINADRTDTNTSILIDFAPKNYNNISTGNYEGNLDHNDKYIIFTAQTDEDNRSVAVILYKLGESTVEWTKTSSKGLWREKSDGNSSTSEAPSTFDWVSVDPTATYIVIAATNDQDTNGKRYVYDMNLSNERILSDTGAHGDMGIDMHGNPVYVQFQFHGEQGIWSHNLVTLEAIKLLPSKYNGGHVSCRNVKRLGWCYVNTSQVGYREVFALKLDAGSGQVQRLAQTHISQQNRGCAQASVSPDGHKVLFSSDWNEGSADNYLWDKDNWKSCTDDSRRIKLDTYQVEF